jgi:hypothetical protein
MERSEGDMSLKSSSNNGAKYQFCVDNSTAAILHNRTTKQREKAKGSD